MGSGPFVPDGFPFGVGGPFSPALYQGLERHSASVPEAEAWHSCKLLNEQPLQPGLSIPWMQYAYWVAVCAEAEPAIPNPPRANNASKLPRIVHSFFRPDYCAARPSRRRSSPERCGAPREIVR
jgi:hypothetical protein